MCDHDFVYHQLLRGNVQREGRASFGVEKNRPARPKISLGTVRGTDLRFENVASPSLPVKLGIAFLIRKMPPLTVKK